MNKNLKDEIDTIATKYVKTVNVLFSTMIFYNTSILYAAETNEERLMSEYNELETDLRALYNDHGDNFYTRVVKKHMRSMCFTSLVSAFEEFLTELSILALKKHPHKISGEQIEFKKVIEMSKDEIIEYKAKEYLNKIMYMAPKDYLKALCQLLSVEQGTLKDSFSKYIEVKARRDLGVHNDWKKNEVYIKKVNEAGTSIPEDALSLRPSHEYLKYSNAVCRDLLSKIINQSCENLFKVKPFQWTIIEIPTI